MKLMGRMSCLVIGIQLMAGVLPAVAVENAASEIIKATAVSGGLCVHLGVTDGKLTENRPPTTDH